MKKRLITSSVYVIVLAGLVAMKWLVPDGWGAIGFDALFCVIAILGSIELLRAVKIEGLAQKSLTVAFCAAIVPVYVIVEITMGLGWLAALIIAFIYAVVILIFFLTGFDGSNSKSTASSLFTMLYCGGLCCLLSALNHLPENSLPAMLVLFFTVMFTDAMAYITGMLLKRALPYKLAPKISPNKTVVGGVGGLIGGIAGAIVAYFMYYGIKGLGYEVVEEVEKLVSHFTVDGLLLGAFILIGFIASVAAQAGDLFESAIKRRCGIKDMGKLLPGHGGILDRFDSMLFAGVVVLLGFILIAV